MATLRGAFSSEDDRWNHGPVPVSAGALVPQAFDGAAACSMRWESPALTPPEPRRRLTGPRSATV